MHTERTLNYEKVHVCVLKKRMPALARAVLLPQLLLLLHGRYAVPRQFQAFS